MAKIIKIDEAPMMTLTRGKGRARLLINESTSNLDVRLVTLDIKGVPGPYHYHSKTENVYVILSGKAKVTIEGKENIVNEGTCVHIKPGEKHTIQNVGSSEVRLIEIYSPPIGEDFIEIKDR